MKTKRFRKLTGMFFAAAVLSLLTACQSGKLADCFTKEEVEQQAVEDIELASSNNYEGDLTYTISYNEDMEMVGFLIK